MRAIVLAGGAGSRLRPLTDTRPKPLVPFCGEPFAAGLLRRLSAVCRHVTFLVGDAEPFDALSGVAGELAVSVDVLVERERLDTAGAARSLLTSDPPDEPVLVCNGDVLTDGDLAALVAAHRRHAATATLALTRVADPSAYGVVVTDGAGAVQAFVEKPDPGAAPADTVNAGCYVLDPRALDAFPGVGPLSFEHDVFPALVAEGARVHGHLDAGFWADLGTPARYLDGTAAVLTGRCRWPLAPAMRWTEPGSLARPGAHTAADADVGSGCVLGARATVGAGARLRDVVLFDDAAVGEGAVAQRLIVGEGAEVTAGAEPPPDTAIADRQQWPPAA
jgi:NDP-sugar pyrophosphorylase family protein